MITVAELVSPERLMMARELATSLVATFGAYGVYRLLCFFYGEWTSPLRDLPGPPNESAVFGNLKMLWGAPSKKLYTTDCKALNHIVMNSSVYQKPAPARWFLSRLLGEGVLIVEGETHKNQRKIMNPAFGAAQIRELTEIFIDKSLELRDAWTAEISREGEVANVNALAWLSRMTLDVIGLAGFNYKFNALADGEERTELSHAFANLFGRAAGRPGPLMLMRARFPLLRWIPARSDASRKQARTSMVTIGKELLQNSKDSLVKDGKFEKSSLTNRNLLTLLVRANMDTDIPENQRMSDEEVLAQVPTFIVAGHETTSTATAWALFALSKAPETQKKLRDELLAVPNDNPSMDELNSLPYLDAVVREALRLHAPVPNSSRVAVKDDVLPLAKPVVDRYGKSHDSILIRKGDELLIPIMVINHDKTIWGEDSHEFK
ncbi:hypothetical protein EST38_g5602 [Candolleomyces aberdarensis]|uniref:Cytochrome P450 n=1 Tax=Candolleomyces aberdarensis TaxID=2316362 RepID=A0A4Q2DK28_9AGAR|nr:hypothetical protein EST38_g5602 [Candolleomyces aberdarensis]